MYTREQEVSSLLVTIIEKSYYPVMSDAEIGVYPPPPNLATFSSLYSTAAVNTGME